MDAGKRAGKRSAAQEAISRSLIALAEAIRLFVYAWNRRQLHHLDYPNYPAHVFEFV